MALLHLLCRLKRKYALRLAVAHLDHGIQKNSHQVQAFVRKTAQQQGLPYYSKTLDVRAQALKNKLSLEDAGRKERYRFFEAVAKRTRSNKIVTAHTLDDQAETFLMRMVRGAGLRGLAGIPYKRKQGRFEILRPLLDCSKKDLISFLKKERLPFIRDKMNRDPVFLRNRVRHQLLPLLARRFNPQIQQALASLQTVCRQAQDYLEHRSRSVFRSCRVSVGPRKIVFDVSRLKALHPALRYETLAGAVAKLKGEITGFGYAHWTAVDPLLSSRQKNSETHWPHQVRVQKKGERLIISAAGRKRPD